MDRAIKVTITYCVLHNFNEIWNQHEAKHIISRNRKENLNGFGAHLLPAHKREVAKIKEKRLRMALYEHWNIRSNLLFSITIKAIKVEFAHVSWYLLKVKFFKKQ